MLSEQSAATVRATLPVVGAAINEITERFYRGMFTARPELLRDLFNRGNQASKAQQQALAGSIAAFATHLVDRPDERPDAMLSRIAHKHASLGIRPDQYDIVHEHLFAAIVEVLGEAVTPEVAAAWDEVYWLMGNALIANEKRLYEEQGGHEWREWEVVERVEETADVATFRIRPVDDRPVAGFKPGQYVSVQVELADGAHQIRQYSLSAAPGAGLRQITVKRVAEEGGAPAGEVSNLLFGQVHAGDVLRVSAPFGDLVLDDADAPLLLASAGIGVTPIAAMLGHLAESGHKGKVTVVHADRSPATHALRADQEAAVAKLADVEEHLWYETDSPLTAHTGLVDLTGVEVAPETHAYLCGPLAFMRAVRGQLLGKGVPAANIHYEVFGPDLWLGQD
ncbi:globin domain-containing protein [Streptomyces sp. UH6]|uniref:globin domain-containing protein n=1 Tax=Streptomyces sp. UH6 TaxID=2748379 RepID=UPI0015D51DD1|nr:globin domain-containing protein [Streptomyces sp. UH6]NYV73870.1 hemin transporter [Streptomyces sp. UH6]